MNSGNIQAHLMQFSKDQAIEVRLHINNLKCSKAQKEEFYMYWSTTKDHNESAKSKAEKIRETLKKQVRR